MSVSEQCATFLDTALESKRSLLLSCYEAAINDPLFRNIFHHLGEDEIAESRDAVRLATTDQLKRWAGQDLKYEDGRTLVLLAVLLYYRNSTVTLSVYCGSEDELCGLLSAGRESVQTLVIRCELVAMVRTVLPTMRRLKSLSFPVYHTSCEGEAACCTVADFSPPSLTHFSTGGAVWSLRTDFAPRLPAPLRVLEIKNAIHTLPWVLQALGSSSHLEVFKIDGETYFGRDRRVPKCLIRRLQDVAFPQLRALFINAVDVPAGFLPLLAFCAPRLESLVIFKGTFDDRPAVPPNRLPNLRFIALHLPVGEGVGSVIDMLRHMPNLRTLMLNMFHPRYDLTMDGLAGAMTALCAFLASRPPLKTLRMSLPKGLSIPHMTSLAEAMGEASQTLTSVRLDVSFPDSAVEGEAVRCLGKAFVDCCPALLMLCICHLSDVWDKELFFTDLLNDLRAHPKLQCLSTDDNDNLACIEHALQAMNNHRKEEAQWRPAWRIVTRGIMDEQERRVAKGGRDNSPRSLCALLPAHVLQKIGNYLPGPSIPVITFKENRQFEHEYLLSYVWKIISGAV